MLETFHWFQGEGFSLIVEDLLRLPCNVPIIVEGFRPLPKLVKPLLSQSTHAVWLLPTPKFREAVVDRRGGASWGFLARTSDPERALHNLLERDQLFTDLLRQETDRLQLPTIEVDSSLDEDELTARVTELFDL